MIPSEAHIRISIPVLLFTIGVTTLAGLLFGTAPAWQATRVDLNEVLKLGGRTGAGGVRRNALRALVVAEFAFALTLLATGGLALRGFWNLTRIDLGIQTDNVLTFRLPVPPRRLNGADQIRAYYGQMLEKIQALPGVTMAAVTTGIPGLGSALILAQHRGPTSESFSAHAHRCADGHAGIRRHARYSMVVAQSSTLLTPPPVCVSPPSTNTL